MTGEYLARLAVAALVGAVIGAEREFRDKAAGFRTIMLICIGACLFTIMGQELVPLDRGDPTRIPSSIVSGVGFLGAGVIFRRGRQSTGITTAATIWCAAALGMGIGGGRYAVSLATAAGILTVLWLLPPVERRIDAQRETRSYDLHSSVTALSPGEIHTLFERHGLRVIECSHGKSAGSLTSSVTALGKHRAHNTVTDELIAADWVIEFTVTA